MEEIKNFVQIYFEQNEKELTQSYPGLKASRLLDEFCQFYKCLADEVYLGQGREFFKSLEQAIPLEYIQSNAYFFKSNFYVDERVLIPRSETEILVEDSLNYINKITHKKPRVAEVGVGSFIIGLTIAMESLNPVDIIGGDISLEAIEVAKINQFKLRSRISPLSSVELIESDKLASFEGKFDLIVSNPPYIKQEADKKGVHFQANKFEPHLALYLKDDEFDEWFESFFKDASSKICKDGLFLMEGHEDSLLHLKEIALKYFEKVEIKKDYTQRNRFLHGFK